MTEAALIGARPLVLSPHTGDGVLSLGATIAQAARSGRDVTVLTVFASDPASDAPAGWLDRRAGFRTEGEAARVRGAEDDRACTHLGARPCRLPFRDVSYGPRPQRAAVVQAIAAAVDEARADTVLAPGFPLRDPDHAWLAALLLARGVPGTRIGLYAGQPHTWRLGTAPAGPSAWRRLSVGATDRRAKRHAVREYRSQLPLLGRLVPSRLALHEAQHGGEVLAWVDDAPALGVVNGSGPEALSTRIERLIAERQALRDASAPHPVLEENRLEIARLQRELSHALIVVHRPESAGRLALVRQDA